MPWTINGTPASAFTTAKLRIGNQSDGTLTLDRDVNADAPAAWPYKHEMLVRDPSGVVRWRGTVRSPRRGKETGTKRSQTLAAADGWSKLARKRWLVDWPYDTSSEKDTQVILAGHLVEVDVSDPESDPPEPQIVYDLVAEDCTATIERAADFAGVEHEIGLSGIIPPQQVDGITVAGVVQAMCRWFPGSVAWVEALTGKLKVRKASAMPSVTLDLTQLTDCDIGERPDLVVPGARLCVRKTRSSSGGAKKDLTVYTAGDLEADGALAEGVEISPETHALDVTNLKITSVGDLDPTSADFWASQVPWVRFAIANPDRYPGFTIYNGRKLNVFPEDGTAPLGNVILKGSVPESFRLRGCTGPYGLREQIVESSNSIHPKFGSVSCAAIAQFVDETTGIIGVHELSVNFLTTDLPNSGRYASEDYVGLDPGESPATFSGVPAQLLAETARLAYEGQIEMIGDEMPADLMGSALNLTGGEAAWATMRAPIHEITIDLRANRARATFGPPQYLGLKDLVAILQARHHKTPPIHRTTKGGLPPSLEPPSGEGGGEQPPPPGTPGAPGPDTQTGTLNVTIHPPAAIADGARWTAISSLGQSYGPNESEVATTVPPGKYTITFEPITGWKRPAIIKGKNVASGGTVTVDEGRLTTYQPVGIQTVPWAIHLRLKDGTDDQWEAKVEKESYLLDGTPVEISNLDTWQDFDEPKRIYLKGTFAGDGRTLTTVQVYLQPRSEAWPDQVKWDDGTPRKQTFFNRPIAEIIAVDGVPAARPITITHLELVVDCFDGRPARYPVPL